MFTESWLNENLTSDLKELIQGKDSVKNSVPD